MNADRGRVYPGKEDALKARERGKGGVSSFETRKHCEQQCRRCAVHRAPLLMAPTRARAPVLFAPASFVRTNVSRRLRLKPCRPAPSGRAGGRGATAAPRSLLASRPSSQGSLSAERAPRSWPREKGSVGSPQALEREDARARCVLTALLLLRPLLPHAVRSSEPSARWLSRPRRRS